MLSSSTSWWKKGSCRAPGSSLMAMAGIRKHHEPRARGTQLWLCSPLTNSAGATGCSTVAALYPRTGDPLAPRGRSSYLATTCTPWRWVTVLRSASHPPCSWMASICLWRPTLQSSTFKACTVDLRVEKGASHIGNPSTGALGAAGGWGCGT